MKLLWLAMGSGAFVAVSIWMIFGDFDSSRWSPVTVKVFGVIGVLLFSFLAFLPAVQLFDRRPGAILNKDGLTYNDGIKSTKHLRWSDIADISPSQVHLQKFIAFQPHDLPAFLAALSGTARKVAQSNVKMTGAPFHITAVNLTTDFDNLYTLCVKYWNAYR